MKEKRNQEMYTITENLSDIFETFVDSFHFGSHGWGKINYCITYLQQIELKQFVIGN